MWLSLEPVSVYIRTIEGVEREVSVIADTIQAKCSIQARPLLGTGIRDSSKDRHNCSSFWQITCSMVDLYPGESVGDLNPQLNMESMPSADMAVQILLSPVVTAHFE